MITVGVFIIALIIILLPLLGQAQDSCHTKLYNRIVFNPGREMDSAFQSDDKWMFVSYEIEQDNYSEVHLKYLKDEKWVELAFSDKKGVYILSGCIPPKSWVLIECLSLTKQPIILKQVETIY